MIAGPVRKINLADIVLYVNNSLALHIPLGLFYFSQRFRRIGYYT